jgi:hypothetical protein
MEVTSSTRHPLQQLARQVQLPILALALVASGAGIGVFASARAQSDATPVGATTQSVDLCPDEKTGAGSEPWMEADLYFGTTREDGTAYSEDEFRAFLDKEITPRFPDGLTLLTGFGQFRNSQGVIAKERSEVLIILFPADTAVESSKKLDEIRALYNTQFHQESVLRADSTPVCTSF